MFLIQIELQISLLFVVVVLLIYSFSFSLLSSVNNLHTYDTSFAYDIINGEIFFEIIEPHELEYTYRLKPAKNFGGSFTTDEFKHKKEHLMVLAQPIEACTTITNDYDLYGRIALISRGECTFLQKAIMAEEAGAIGVIITDIRNSSNDDHFIEMVHDNSSYDTTIPAGYLLGRDGRIIVAALQNSGLDRAQIRLPLNLTFTPLELHNHPPWSTT